MRVSIYAIKCTNLQLLLPKATTGLSLQIFEIELDALVTPRSKVYDFLLAGITESTIGSLGKRIPLFVTGFWNSDMDVLFHRV